MLKTLSKTSAAFAALFQCDVPVLLAGMGGVASPELAVAVSKAGAFGNCGLYRHQLEEISAMLDWIARQDVRCGVNFVSDVLSEPELLDRLQIVSSHPLRPIVSFFGAPPLNVMRYCADAGLHWGVQVGAESDARHCVEHGADFIILQSSEAGGHHLGQLSLTDTAQIAQMPFLRSVVVIRSGGVATSSDLADALADGFDGVMCGTLFAAAAESNAHPKFKSKILASDAGDTEITDAFSIGWADTPHRVIRNETCKKDLPPAIIGKVTYFGKSHPVWRYSVSVPTKTTEGEVAEMALYCGTSCNAISTIRPVTDIIAQIRG